jgi:hypothetical protein
MIRKVGYIFVTLNGNVKGDVQDVDTVCCTIFVMTDLAANVARTSLKSLQERIWEIAMLFCTLIILSTIGNSLGTRSSFAQVQQVKSQIPSTISTHPVNTTQTKSTSLGSSQPLCAAGICDQSSNPASLSSQVPTKVKTNFQNTFMNTKSPTLTHSFSSYKVIGPDRFRFIRSFWTTSDYFGKATNALLPTNIVGSMFTGSSATCPSSLINSEVDRGQGYTTLAVELQYQGVVSLYGITAALKLPSGFEAQVPVTDNRNNYDIALSNYNFQILPHQAIVLCFPINVLPNAVPRLPVLGPLALHFLRADTRSITDTINTSDQNMFTRMFTIMKTTFPNSTSLTNMGTSTTNYMPQQFIRGIPFDFIDQVIPVVFQDTGQTILDVTLPRSSGITFTQPIPYTNGVVASSVPTVSPGAPANAPATIPAGTIITRYLSPVKIAFTNQGDVPLTGLVTNINTPEQVTVAGQLSASLSDIGLVDPSTYYIGTLFPHIPRIITVLISGPPDSCSALVSLTISSQYTNAIGLRLGVDPLLAAGITGALFTGTAGQQINNLPVELTGSCSKQFMSANPVSGTPVVAGSFVAPGLPVPLVARGVPGHFFGHGLRGFPLTARR